MLLHSTLTAGELITSNDVVPPTMLVKQLIDWFKANPHVEYAAVGDASGVCGMVGVENLNSRIAGNKFGHSVLSDKPVTRVLIENALIVDASISLSDLVEHLIEKRGAGRNFYEDIIVHDGKGTFVGLVSVRQLLIKQMLQINEQVHALQRQQNLVAQRNQELMETIMRMEHDQARLQKFFEHCSIPVLVMSHEGQVIRANKRFYTLTGFDEASLSNRPSETLFHFGIFKGLLDSYEHAKSDFEEWNPTYAIALKHSTGNLLGVELSFSVDLDQAMVIVFILRQMDANQASVAEAIHQRAAQQPSMLARNVASNLIDKEYNLEAALQKLDAIISLADKIELKKPASPSITETQSRLGWKTLNGALGQFSIVDLVQLLIQSRKGGGLEITDPEENIGKIFFDRGLIVHALYKDHVGKLALRKMMTMEAGTFEFHYDTVSPQVSIEGHDPMGVLMEACAENDEAEANTGIDENA